MSVTRTGTGTEAIIDYIQKPFHTDLYSIQTCQKMAVRLLIQWSWGRAPLGVTFFAVVKSFDTNNTISGNFVLNVKKSIETYHIEWFQDLKIGIQPIPDPSFGPSNRSGAMWKVLQNITQPIHSSHVPGSGPRYSWCEYTIILTVLCFIIT